MKKILAIAALMSSAAFADQVQLISIEAGSPLGADTYTFNYEYAVSNNVRYEVGDFFTIYDFDTAIGAATSGAAADWGFEQSIDSIGLDPADGPPAPIFGGDTLITNVTFTKTLIGNGNLMGPITIGGFTVYSQYGCGTNRNSTDVSACSSIYFKGEGTNNTGIPGQDGNFNGAEGSTQGPSNDAVIPEPATMGLMGGALLGLGLLARRRK